MAAQAYAVLVRGINVGGKNKVDMATLREQLTQLGFQGVQTYINSGNIFFNTDRKRSEVLGDLSRFFAATYPFITDFALLSQTDYQADYVNLPDWWQTELARKDVLFFTEGMDKADAIERIQTYSLHDEVIHIGQVGVYWGQYSEAEFLKTSYHKKLIKEDFYKQVTIRNGKTAAKIAALLNRETVK